MLKRMDRDQDTYDKKSVWYHLVHHLDQVEIHECESIIGKCLIEDNQALWQELRSFQSITDISSESEKSYCEISVSFRENFIRKSSSSSSSSSSRPICMNKLLIASFLNEIRSHFQKEKLFLEKEIQNISEYDQFSFKPMNDISSYSIIESSPKRYDLSMCKNCHSSLPTVNTSSSNSSSSSSSSSNLLQSKSTSSLPRNESKLNEVPRLCIKCKELMRRDKILNGRLPSNTPIDSDLHIQISLTLENNSSDGGSGSSSNITKTNIKMSATKSMSKSVPTTPSSSSLKPSIDNQKANVLRMNKAYDDYAAETDRVEFPDVVTEPRMNSNSGNSSNVNSRNNSSDSTTRNKIRNKIETAKDEHHFMDDF